MENSEHPVVERLANTRTSQACQRCRSLKTRCLPSERPGTCQRCFNSKRECTWAETPRRARRGRGPSRISQVEQKIDGLVASLVNQDTFRPAEAVAAETPSTGLKNLSRTYTRLAPGSWLPIPTSFDHEEASIQNEENREHDTEPDCRFLEKLRAIHSFTDGREPNRAPNTLFHGSARNEPEIDNALVKQLLTSGEADALLEEYRSMSASFPFVPIPSTVTAREIHAAKPMLFLAIITVASWKEHQRQRSLDELYRTEVATRTIIRPRRTLSLLQSTLVYLSWYHFVFSHKTQQIFFMQQLAIGLAIDIGLHQRLRRPPIEFPGKPKLQPPSPEEKRERQRTFLGCYFLSSMIAGGLQKPNLLKFTDYMVECGNDLKCDREYASDEIIGHLIALRRIDDQIHDSFFSEDAIDLPIIDSRITMNVRFIESQLEEWRRGTYSELFQRVLDLSHSFTDMTLHSVGLRGIPESTRQSGSSPLQLNALLSALEAGKRFLDTLLAFPASDYNLISFSEWMRLPSVVMTVARLCIPCEAHTIAQWDVKAAQDRVRLDLCLESLCYRMQSLSTYNKPKQPHPDFWWAMRMIMDLTRAWYTRKIRSGKTPSSHASPNDLPTPNTLHSMNSGSMERSGSSMTPSTDGTTELPYPLMGAAMENMSMDTSSGWNDPFAFMRNMDFDMDQFLDMGIWGDESYVGMGFGGGMQF